MESQSRAVGGVGTRVRQLNVRFADLPYRPVEVRVLMAGPALLVRHHRMSCRMPLDSPWVEATPTNRQVHLGGRAHHGFGDLGMGAGGPQSSEE